MSTTPEPGNPAAPSPDQAFALLGDDTRLQIVRILGEANGPLQFSELFDRIDYEDSSNFGYHLKKLTGHFVKRTEEDYELRQPGRRVVEAILSGTVTNRPSQEPTPVDRPCPFCSSKVEVAYQQERVEMHCPECAGMEERPATRSGEFDRSGNLGHLLLPPAGIQGRTAAEMLRAAEIWTATEAHATVREVCPRCSAPLVHSVDACRDHDAEDGRCDDCGQRFGAAFEAACTNCIFEWQAPMVTYLAGQPELLEFMMDHGIHPLSSEAFVFPTTAVEEAIDSAEPFSANYTFSADGERLILAVEDDLSVSAVTSERTDDHD